MLSKSISFKLAAGQVGMGLRSKISRARSRNCRIHSGSRLYSEICSTMARFRPRWDLKLYCSGSWNPYLYSFLRSSTLTAIVRHLPVVAVDAEASQDWFVAFGLELAHQLRAAGFDDAPPHQDVHPVGLDVLEDPLIVGDEQDRRVRLVPVHLVHAFAHDPERVDVQAGIRLVQDGEPRLEHR